MKEEKKMKKLLSILLALVLLASALAAVAEEKRQAPEDKKTITTELNESATSVFHMYNGKFYDEPSTQPGTVERLDYTTSVYGDTLNQWANVYLPYGYDATNQYNIIYFTHGANEMQDSFIGDEKVKNAIDNMIEVGVAEPFILVCPTYYYDYENRAVDFDLFVTEVRQDLMPAVESKYATYAETADDAGFSASRTHRCFAGYSQGSKMCWNISYNMYDWAKWFCPFSGVDQRELPLNMVSIHNAMEKYSEYKDDIFYYIALGGKRDVAYEGMMGMIQLFLEDEAFSFGTDPQENNFYASVSNEIHQALKARYFFYNAFKDVLFK